MSWPLSHDFNEAVQNPQLAFQDPDLKGGETVVGATGLPLPRSGNFADVYQLRGADGREWAVKCFTRPVVGLAERYAKISDALARSELPFTVGFTYLADGIRVGGAWRPIVKMEWVEGLLLNQVVRDNTGSIKVLTALGAMWAKLCKRLREANVAHADLQHGNVLLVPGSRPGAYGLKLIDYDGMWVKALANTPSGESGHPSYQHPGRASGRVYSPDVDRFPHLAIAAVMRGLVAGGSALWNKYDNGDNLLFTETDYKNPAASAAMRDLWNTDDPVAQALVGRLAIACGKPVPQTPWLDQIAPDGDAAPLDDAMRREAAAALGISLPVPAALPPEPAPVAADWSAPPLPPEPAPEPAFEVVPETAFTLDPEPVVTARRAPLKPVAVIAEDDADVELVQEERRARPAKKGRPKEPPQGGNGRVLLYAGGGLLLLLGGVVAGVLIGGRSKPTETAQKEPPPKVEPAPKVADDPRPKANPKAEPPVRPPVEPPVNPPPSDPNPPVAGALKPLWSLRTNAFLHRLVVSGPRVFGTPLNGRTDVFDVRNGGRYTTNNGGGVDHVESRDQFPLTDGGIAVWSPGRDIQMWGESGLPIGTIPLRDGPPKPADAPDASLYVSVSPDGRYYATGWVSGNPSKVEPGQALQIHDSKAKKVVKLTWAGGKVLFTADSSRVLIAEYSGKGRWHKLSTGASDGDPWDLGPPPGYRHEITGMSADGSVLGYLGSLDGPNAIMGATIDGKTGAVLQRFRQATNNTAAPVVSADGKWVAVHRPDAKGFVTVDVADTRTGARLAAIPTDARVVAFAFSEDGKALVVSSNEPPMVRAYDLGAGAAVAVQPPDPPAPQAAGVLKPRWELRGEFYARLLVADGRVFGARPGPGGGAAFDLATGARRADFADLEATRFHTLYPLTGGRVGTSVFNGPTMRLWDTKTGRDAGQMDFPRPPLPNEGVPYRAISRDGRYCATGALKFGPKVETVTPLRVYDAQTKQAVVSADWSGGHVHFTADSSRALVAEHGGKCRWYKLPSGEPDGEGWNLGPPRTFRHEITGISADGTVLAYVGPLDLPNGIMVATLDGKTGAVLRRFPESNNNTLVPLVSADGRRVTAHRTDPKGLLTIDVADARTGARVARVIPDTRLAACAFSEDGKTLVVSSHEPSTLRAYDLDGGEVVAVKPPEPPAGGPVTELKVRWSAPLTDGTAVTHLHADPKADLLVAASTKGESGAYSLLTGNKRPGFGGLGGGGVTEFMPLDGRFVAVTFGGQQTTWDQPTGRNLGPFAVPKTAANGLRAVSRDGKYFALGHNGDPTGLPKTDHPLVIATADGKALVTTDWKGGTVHFTADGRRALVAERAGRFRWYKLPDGGDPVAEWKLDGATELRQHAVTSVTADGALIGYDGPAGHPPLGSGPSVLDGETGKIVHRFGPGYGGFSGVSLSADGRRAAVPRAGPAGSCQVEVVDPRTGTALARAAVESGTSVPHIFLTPDGNSLVVTAGSPQKSVFVFGVPAPGGAAMPPVRPQAPPAPAAEGQLKERWSVELKAPLQSGRVAFDADGQAVAVMGGGIRWTVAAVDARTGKEYLPLLNRKGNSTELIPLDKGRFGYYADSDRAVTTWTPTNGKEVSAPVPGERGGREPFVRVSPNARYMLVSPGVRNPGRETPEVPLQVLDLTAGGPAIQHAWRPGRVMFTADSSRALVVDDTDRFRWFKLPGARPDGEWKFDRPPNGFNAHVVGMSAKGEVLLFEGTPTGAAMGLHLLNGKDGTVLHTFPAKRYHTSWGAVSEDGRMVALVRNDGFGVGHTVEVVTDGGDLVASVKLPAKDWAIAFSWKGRALAIYERDARRLTAYDLPEPPRP